MRKEIAAVIPGQAMRTAAIREVHLHQPGGPVSRWGIREILGALTLRLAVETDARLRSNLCEVVEAGLHAVYEAAGARVSQCARQAVGIGSESTNGGAVV